MPATSTETRASDLLLALVAASTKFGGMFEEDATDETLAFRLGTTLLLSSLGSTRFSLSE